MLYPAPERLARRRFAASTPTFGLFAIIVGLVCSSGRWGPDWPAQEFRAWSAAHDGLTTWTNSWYSGLALPGYSVIYPVVAGVIGAALTGGIATVAAWCGAARFAPAPRRLAFGYHASVAWVLLADLAIGQVPFLLGVAFGVWALCALADRRPRLALLAAAACSLSSPLAGGLLLLAAISVTAAVGVRRSAPLLAGTVGLVVAEFCGGTGGEFPFVPRIACWIAVFVVTATVMVRGADRPVRVFAVSYGAVSLVLLLFANPVGGNVARYGQLVALPLFWYVYPRLRWRHWTVAVGVSLAAALWTAWPAMTAVYHGAGDPSQQSSYYTGLLRYLDRHDARHGRVEVVFTREHWESFLVARNVPLARGWERQVDLAVNDVLYHPLTDARYAAWLRTNAVDYVALPDVAIDYGGRAEAALLRHPPNYLQKVWGDRHWTLWRVRNARPIVVGPAAIRAQGPASFVLDFRRGGTAVVDIRASPMWTATSGEACVGSRGPWLTVSSRTPGSVIVRSQLHLPDMGTDSGERRCS